jgi:hypothetical protein
MKKYILFLFLIVPIIGFSQDVPDVNAKSPKPEKMSKVEKKAIKKKVKQKQKAEKADKKLRKQQIKMQTKDVQKRMKKNKRKAKRYNENKKEFFITRWFRRQSAY